ncbi:hypothetical protein ERO13_1Z049334v2 [Gossypium hirsutum]|nr:hypothetical protein ERO13_1Z049334v2 [Gossypium hirsutum]
MRRGKIAPDGNEARKRSEKGDSKSLNAYFKQRKSRTEDFKCRDLEGENQKQIRESGNENKGKPGKGFFACYLLTSLSPRHKGHTYIGFTVNPLRRIRQHNGEIGSGAWRTKSRRPWEMVVCIYGREASSCNFKSFSGVTNKIKLAYTMLTLPAWQSLNITINYFSTKYTNHSASCPSLPEQMKVKVSPMDELPCYTEPNEIEYKDDCDNLDEYDEVSDTCETVPETYPNEVVIVSADNLHSIIHEACHEQSEHIEEHGTRKPGESSNLGVGVFEGMRFKYAVEADEDPQPSVKEVKEKPSTTDEEYEKLGDTCTFGVYHRQSFDVICSPVRASSSVFTSLSNEETAEGTNVSIIEKECRIQKQFSAFVAASGDQQSWRKEKPLTTEVAVLKEHVPSFDVTREPEVIDLLTPSPSYRVRPCTKKRRISKFSPEIIDLT